MDMFLVNDQTNHPNRQHETLKTTKNDATKHSKPLKPCRQNTRNHLNRLDRTLETTQTVSTGHSKPLKPSRQDTRNHLNRLDRTVIQNMWFNSYSQLWNFSIDLFTGFCLSIGSSQRNRLICIAQRFLLFSALLGFVCQI